MRIQIISEKLQKHQKSFSKNNFSQKFKKQQESFSKWNADFF